MTHCQAIDARQYNCKGIEMYKNIRLAVQTIVIPVVLLMFYFIWVASLELGIWGNVGMACLWVFLISNYYLAVYCYNCLRNNKELETLSETEQQLNHGGS